MNARRFTEGDIHLALDGELPADERDAYEAWLQANPDMLARSERFAGDMAQLRDSLRGMLDEPLPPRLLARLDRVGTRRSWRHAGRTWRMAAAAVLLVAGLAGGYAIGASGWQPAAQPGLWIADGAIAAHDVFAAEKLHVVEVGADQKDHLQGWLSKRVGLTLVAPDLSPQGYRLVGGRLLPVEHRSAAQFMYQDGEGNRVSLLVARDPTHGDTGFRSSQLGATRALYWLDDGYGCAVTGAATETALKSIAESAYKQLLEGMEG